MLHSRPPAAAFDLAAPRRKRPHLALVPRPDVAPGDGLTVRERWLLQPDGAALALTFADLDRSDPLRPGHIALHLDWPGWTPPGGTQGEGTCRIVPGARCFQLSLPGVQGGRLLLEAVPLAGPLDRNRLAVEVRVQHSDGRRARAVGHSLAPLLLGWVTAQAPDPPPAPHSWLHTLLRRLPGRP